MNRRDFFKTTAIIGGTAAGLSASFAALSKAHSDLVPIVDNIEIIDTLENKQLRFELKNDGSAIITDKISNHNWTINSVAVQDDGEVEETRIWMRGDRTLMEQYPGRFAVKKQGSAYLYTLFNADERAVGSFTVHWTLTNEWLNVKLTVIDESIPSLVFPQPIVSDTLVLPIESGKLVHKETNDIWTRKFLAPFAALGMQWFGGMKDGHAWLGVFEGNENVGGMQINNTISPCWLKSLSQWKGTYEFKYKFIKGGYVELAKTYRQYLIDTGKFVSLKEKIKNTPALANLLGGRVLSYFLAWPEFRKESAEDYMMTPTQIEKQNNDGVKVDFTYKEALKSIKYAQTKGFNKGMITHRGWIKDGYDASHPDIWPPEPKLGSITELKSLLDFDSDNIISGLHDNYQDMYDNYPSFPKGINLRKKGDRMRGGLWAGGQAYILNAKTALGFAKRNWQETKVLEPTHMFIDTTAASYNLQSYDATNPATRSDDRKNKRELLKFYKDQNLILGSESGCDDAIDLCDYFENRHHRTAGETVPLWSLILHDSTFISRYTSFTPGSEYPKYLEDLLWGYQLQFFMEPSFGNIRLEEKTETHGFGATEMTETLFVDSFIVDEWHKRIGLEEMTNHEFVNGDHDLESTEYANGAKIVVNFSTEEKTAYGLKVPAHGFKIVR